MASLSVLHHASARTCTTTASSHSVKGVLSGCWTSGLRYLCHLQTHKQTMQRCVQVCCAEPPAVCCMMSCCCRPRWPCTHLSLQLLPLRPGRRSAMVFVQARAPQLSTALRSSSSSCSSQAARRHQRGGTDCWVHTSQPCRPGSRQEDAAMQVLTAQCCAWAAAAASQCCAAGAAPPGSRPCAGVVA